MCGGFVGSVIRLLSDRTIQKQLKNDPLSIRFYLSNLTAWTAAAGTMGSLLAVNNQWLGLVVGLMTGLLGVDAFRKLALMIDKEGQLTEIIMQNRGVKSLKALEELLIRRPFVKGVEMTEEFGKVVVQIIPGPDYVSAIHLSQIEELISSLRPLGTVFEFIEPPKVRLNIIGKVVLAESLGEATGEAAQTAIKAGQEFIEHYIRHLALGEPLRVNALIAEFAKGAVEGIIDLIQVQTTPAINPHRQVPIPANHLADPGEIKLVPV